MLPIGLELNGRYRVEYLIGQGGMAAVYVVTHISMGRRFALKIMSFSLVNQPDLIERFAREAKILGALDHPHIVGVIDSDVYLGQYPYLVMDLLEGKDLSQFMGQAGKLPASIALPIFLQIARALQGAHAAGVIHRDLKPANIFVCAKGPVQNFIKVLDFGIAKISQSDGGCQTQASAVIGTPAYMAPEQALGQNYRIDARTDQFALAVILYEMLAGQPAFYRPGEAMLMTLSRVAYAEPEPLLDDSQLWSALQRALHKDPDQRFPSLQHFIDASGVLELSDARSIAPLSLPPLESAPLKFPIQAADGEREPPLASTFDIAPVPRERMEPNRSRFWPHAALWLAALGMLFATIRLQRGRLRAARLKEPAPAVARQESRGSAAWLVKVPITPVASVPPDASPAVAAAEIAGQSLVGGLAAPVQRVLTGTPAPAAKAEFVPPVPPHPGRSPAEDAAAIQLRPGGQIVVSVHGAGLLAADVARCIHKTMSHVLSNWVGRLLYLSIDPVDGGLMIARQEPAQLPTKFASAISDHCLKQIHLPGGRPTHKVIVEFRRDR